MGEREMKDRRRVLVEMCIQFDSDLFGPWSDALATAVEPVELDDRTQALLVVALDSVVHWSHAVVEEHINLAFEAGSNVVEMIEAVEHLANVDSGVHGLHDGLGPLLAVIRWREGLGLPTPIRGAGLGPDDMTQEAPWPDPPVFPFHSPAPRHNNLVLAEYHPELWEAYKVWQDARFKLRKELTRRNQELLMIACDTVVCWPEPMLDHHIHAAFETGATAQEIIETMVLAVAAAQGARDTNPGAWLLSGGVVELHHGVAALDRVLEQRGRHELLAPLDRTKPRIGRPALTQPDADPDTLSPTMRPTRSRDATT
jgi:alkylhydroperoxidase/carboxymuconolactone decarboxylase family protein YurZ